MNWTATADTACRALYTRQDLPPSGGRAAAKFAWLRHGRTAVLGGARAGIATPYEKTTRNYLAIVTIAAIERPRLVTRLLDPSGALKIRHEHLANERPRSAEAPARQHIARIMNSEIYAADTDQQGQDRGGHYEMNAN